MVCVLIFAVMFLNSVLTLTVMMFLWVTAISVRYSTISAMNEYVYATSTCQDNGHFYFS